MARTKVFKDGSRYAAATVRIHDGARMTKRGRLAIANWLRQQAKNLETLGADYEGLVSSRYLVRKNDL